MHTQKTGSDLQLIANLIRFFNLRHRFFKDSFYYRNVKLTHDERKKNLRIKALA